MKKSISLTIIIASIFLGSAAFKYINSEKKVENNIAAAQGQQNQTTSTKPVAVPGTQFLLPPGFSLSTYASNLGKPRVIEFDPNGNMLVSIPSQGRVAVLPDTNKDGKSDRRINILSGLRSPHGLALRCSATSTCDLYVAETHQLSVYKYDPKTIRATGKRKLLSLPSGGGHVTRSLLLTREENRDVLLVSVGSSCNVCRESHPWRAAVVSYDIQSGKADLYARGLRNSVFMTIHPQTGQVWATEMGRDMLGDDIPPEEINIIVKPTSTNVVNNYGWPICYGKNIHDTNFDKNQYIRNPCMEPFETPSHIDMQAHSAPLGLAFVPSSWPAEYANDLLVAFHGSWNRSVPTGYKVVRLKLNNEGAYEGIEDFMTGFVASNGRKTGRPADVKVGPDGRVYVSDDQSGKIYRISR